MWTLPTCHASCWQPRPSDNPPAGFSIRPPREISPGFLLRSVVRDAPTGRTLLFLSDLHWPPPDPGEYRSLADAINRLQVDWILYGGDVSTYLEGLAPALGWLASLEARRGRAAVLGNRERSIFWRTPDFWTAQFRSAGCTLLLNSSLEADGFRLYGVDDARYGHPDWSRLQPDPECFTVSLSHNPDAVADAPPQVFVGDLVLCGHTHAGQFSLPGVGPLYSSSKYGRQFLKGFQRRDDGAVCLVSSGIGEAGRGFLKHRLNTRRDLWLVTI